MITKIQTLNYTQKPKQSNTSFKGAVLNGLNFLATNQGLGACAVDLGSMVIPRTVIDAKKRGPQAGIETGIRESSSCFIHAAIGLIGTAIGAAISKGLNKTYSIKAHKIFANSETIDYCANLWKNSASNKEYFTQILSSMSGLDGEVWKKIPESLTEELSTTLANSNSDKNVIKKAVAQITKATGAQANFQIKNGEGVISNSISTLLEHAKSLQGAFDSVGRNVDANTFTNFVTKLKSTKLKTTIAGLGFCAALCMSIQPINKLLTKLRTGQDGFVGVQGSGEDKSKAFRTKKTLIGLSMLTAMHASIGNPKNFIKNIQFNSNVPTINQFKFLYGLTIASRILSSRDKNELREGVIKDSLGFTNWLILGGMVSKLTARAFGKELINNPVVAENSQKGIKYAAKWITQASVKNYSEILMPVAKELTKDGKMLSIGQLFKAADKLTKTKVLKVAASQIAGYLYSGLVLGVGIAKLNIFITNKVKQKEREAELKDNPINVKLNTKIKQNNPLYLGISYNQLNK